MFALQSYPKGYDMLLSTSLATYGIQRYRSGAAVSEMAFVSSKGVERREQHWKS